MRKEMCDGCLEVGEVQRMGTGWFCKDCFEQRADHIRTWAWATEREIDTKRWEE